MKECPPSDFGHARHKPMPVRQSEIINMMLIKGHSKLQFIRKPILVSKLDESRIK